MEPEHSTALGLEASNFKGLDEAALQGRAWSYIHLNKTKPQKAQTGYT